MSKPYPKDLEEQVTLPSGERVFLRPIRPEDEEAHQEFFTHLTKHDVYFRFFGYIKGFSHEQMMRYTVIDYDREMAFIAVGQEPPIEGRTIGVMRVVSDESNEEAEFAIIVRSDFKGHGLGYALMDKMVRYCREKGLSAITGQVLGENSAMIQMAQEFGFKPVGHPEAGVVNLRLELLKDN